MTGRTRDRRRKKEPNYLAFRKWMRDSRDLVAYRELEISFFFLPDTTRIVLVTADGWMVGEPLSMLVVGKKENKIENGSPYSPPSIEGIPRKISYNKYLSFDAKKKGFPQMVGRRRGSCLEDLLLSLNPMVNGIV
jgi:hypothetical protein